MAITSSTPAQPRASLDAVLDFAWDADAFTSGDVVAATGVTRSTAIEALDGLIARGFLRELPNARAAGDYRKGRPARRFELDARHRVVVGLDAGRGHITATLADLRGEPLAHLTRLLDVAFDTAAERRVAIDRAIEDVLSAAGRSASDVLAVCVGVPAPVDAAGRSPRHRDGFWARMNPDLIDALGRWAPIVRVDNDASLAAVAEGTRGAAIGEADFVVLLAGERFGAGTVVDGRLLRGARGGAGEMVAFDHVVGVGTANGLGSRLAEWAADERASLPPGHPLRAGEPTARAVLELAVAGDAWARGLTQRAGELLARVTAVFGSLFDPALVVVAGAVSQAIGPVLDAAREALPADLDLPAPRLVASDLGADVVAIGAVAAAVEAARERALRLLP